VFLCGWQVNKNVLLIPEIAYHFKKHGINFNIILTAPNDFSILHKQFLELVSNYDVEDMITIVGPVKKEELFSLYSQIDYVFLLSKLESFSNNIIEAWTYKKVLVISDEEWSHGICKNAALYVNRDSPSEIVSKIINQINNKK
jgi:glycosyltransferase involved in cell wall biosynthesis